MSVTALVTGASAGFGAAIARRFVRDGHRVIATARRTDRLHALRDELGAALLPFALDVSDPAAVAAAAAECAANLLVLDPAGFPAAALGRLAGEFAARSASEIPATLAARPAGCGCKGH